MSFFIIISAKSKSNAYFCHLIFLSMMKINNFSDRHIGPRDNDIKEMLKVVKADSLSQLIDETIPKQIHLKLFVIMLDKALL